MKSLLRGVRKVRLKSLQMVAKFWFPIVTELSQDLCSWQGTAGPQAWKKKKESERERGRKKKCQGFTGQSSLALWWMRQGTCEPEPWERGKGEREKKKTKNKKKQSNGNDLRRNIHLLNMILECKIGIEANKSNKNEIECPKPRPYSINCRGTTCFSAVNKAWRFP